MKKILSVLLVGGLLLSMMSIAAAGPKEDQDLAAAKAAFDEVKAEAKKLKDAYLAAKGEDVQKLYVAWADAKEELKTAQEAFNKATVAKATADQAAQAQAEAAKKLKDAQRGRYSDGRFSGFTGEADEIRDAYNQLKNWLDAETEDDAGMSNAEYITRKILPANSVLSVSALMARFGALEAQVGATKDASVVSKFEKEIDVLHAEFGEIRDALAREDRLNAKVSLGALLPGGIRLIEATQQRLMMYKNIITLSKQIGQGEQKQKSDDENKRKEDQVRADRLNNLANKMDEFFAKQEQQVEQGLLKAMVTRYNSLCAEGRLEEARSFLLDMRRSKAGNLSGENRRSFEKFVDAMLQDLAEQPDRSVAIQIVALDDSGKKVRMFLEPQSGSVKPSANGVYVLRQNGDEIRVRCFADAESDEEVDPATMVGWYTIAAAGPNNNVQLTFTKVGDDWVLKYSDVTKAIGARSRN